MKRFFLSSLFLASLCACQQPATYRPQVTDAERNAEEEHQRQMIEKASETGGAPRPWRNREGMQKQFERVADKIEPAAARMCQQMGLPKLKRRCYYYFDTTRATDINASADGKTITVTRGMLRFLEDDSELAVIMGHEIAHNMMGHLDAQQENAMAGMMLGAVLAGMAGQPANMHGGLQDSATMAGALSYSQEFEAEADYVGLYIAARAGYNIRKAPDLWRRMSLEEPDGVYNSFTHPTNPERAVALRKAIDEIEYKKKNRLPLVPQMQDGVIEGDYKAEHKTW